MTRLVCDLRFALRSLAKRPAFSLLVVVILGLGIGATTAVVYLTNLLAWRPIPVEKPHEVVKIYTAGHRGVITPYSGTVYPDYEDYRDAAQSMSGLAAGNLWEFRVDTGEATELMWSAGVTENYFEVLGLRPALGRFFGPDDDVAGAEPVLVLAHHLWRKLGSDRDLIGRSMTLEGKPFTILGVGREIDPNLVLSDLRTGPEHRRNNFAIERMQAQAVGVFAVFGFLLAVVGIFGVLSYSVSHRVREIGIRMAIGARGADVRCQVVGQGVAMALFGVVFGLGATIGATLLGASYLDELLYGVAPRDVGVLAAVVVTVLLSCALAAYLPARRASRLDPLVALRHE